MVKLKKLWNLTEIYKDISRCKTCGSLKSNSKGCNGCENNKSKYNKICVVGFDCFQKNKPTYYYPVKEYNNKIKYLINHKIISENGIFLINSGHNSEKTKKYYEYEIQKNPNIEFLFITNAIFNKFNNLKIL